MPVTVPAGVDVSIKEDQISVKGAGGQLAVANNALVKVNNEGGKLSFVPANDSREANAMSGTLRQLVNNMVTGVTKGFEKKAEPGGRGLQSPSRRCQAQPGCRLLAPGGHRDADWHHRGHAEPDRDRDQGR